MSENEIDKRKMTMIMLILMSYSNLIKIKISYLMSSDYNNVSIFFNPTSPSSTYHTLLNIFSNINQVILLSIYTTLIRIKNKSRVRIILVDTLPFCGHSSQVSNTCIGNLAGSTKVVLAKYIL